VQIHESAVAEYGLFDLQRQLPRGGNDKRPDESFLWGVLVAEAVEDWQHKRSRLACAGLGAANHVSAFKRSGDRLELNFRRGGITGGKDTLHEGIGKTKNFERHQIILKKVGLKLVKPPFPFRLLWNASRLLIPEFHFDFNNFAGRLIRFEAEAG